MSGEQASFLPGRQTVDPTFPSSFNSRVHDMRGWLSGLLVATAVIGCDSTPKPPNISLDQRSASAVGDETLTGQVLEHIAASPYSYVRIRTSKGDVWAAVNEARIEKGSKVTVSSPMLMKNFTSKSLNRTFDEIYFGSLAPEGAAATGAAGNPHAGSTSTAAPFDVNVAKATGSNARTIAETWAQASALEGKSVTIHGKVVKYNEGVMGKNWIHLQDGSGDVGQGTNDLTVTSTDATSVGETVSIAGTVHTNRDFGSGYVYRVIVEDAKVVKK